MYQLDPSAVLAIFPNAACRSFSLECLTPSLLSTVPSHLALLSHSLTSLELSYLANDVSTNQVNAPVDDVLSKFPSLTYLSLERNFFTTKIHLALRNLTSLVELCLECSQLDVGFLEILEGPNRLPCLNALNIFFVTEFGRQWDPLDPVPEEEDYNTMADAPILDGWTVPFDAPLSTNLSTMVLLRRALHGFERPRSNWDTVWFHLMTYVIEVYNRAVMRAAAWQDFNSFVAAQTWAMNHSFPLPLDEVDFYQVIQRDKHLSVDNQRVYDPNNEEYYWNKFILVEHERYAGQTDD